MQAADTQDFAYVDFETDEDMQKALQAGKSTIGETTFSITVSNPPPRSSSFGMRGRGTFRRGGARGGAPVGGRKE